MHEIDLKKRTHNTLIHSISAIYTSMSAVIQGRGLFTDRLRYIAHKNHFKNFARLLVLKFWAIETLVANKLVKFHLVPELYIQLCFELQL